MASQKWSRSGPNLISIAYCEATPLPESIDSLEIVEFLDNFSREISFTYQLMSKIQTLTRRRCSFITSLSNITSWMTRYGIELETNMRTAIEMTVRPPFECFSLSNSMFTEQHFEQLQRHNWLSRNGLYFTASKTSSQIWFLKQNLLNKCLTGQKRVSQKLRCVKVFLAFPVT